MDRWWVIHDDSIREALCDVAAGLSPQEAYAKLEEWVEESESFEGGDEVVTCG